MPERIVFVRLRTETCSCADIPDIICLIDLIPRLAAIIIHATMA